MNDEFDNLNLYFQEKLKLFIMRYKKHVTADFLGDSLVPLLGIKFITSHYSFTDTLKTKNHALAFYSLTDRYFRYCVYRRNKFLDSKIWPFVISIISAIATSIITALLSSTLGAPDYSYISQIK